MDPLNSILAVLRIDIAQIFAELVAELSKRCVFIPLTVGAGTSTAVATLILTLGFGPAGVVAGSLAAAFQAWSYGGFTPAGGIFATMTSMGMLGVLSPIVALLSIISGAMAAFIASRQVPC